jgi:hypothetical protein
MSKQDRLQVEKNTKEYQDAEGHIISPAGGKVKGEGLVGLRDCDDELIAHHMGLNRINHHVSLEATSSQIECTTIVSGLIVAEGGTPES